MSNLGFQHSTCIFFDLYNYSRAGSRLSGLLGHALGLLLHSVNVSNHVKGGLGDVVVLALEDLLEARDGVLKRDELALHTGEDLGHSERPWGSVSDCRRGGRGENLLRHETLDLTGTLDNLHVSTLQKRVNFDLQACPARKARPYQEWR